MLAVLDPAVTALGGPTQGADPIAVATAVTAAGEGRSLKAFSIRARAKEHGVGGRLVGPVGPEDRVAVVEDTTTTGGSLLEAVDVLTDEGSAAWSRRSSWWTGVEDGWPRRLPSRGIPYRALLVPADLGVGA